MNIQTIRAEIEAGFADAQTIIAKVTEYIPVLEAIVPQDADELKAVQDAANSLAPLVKSALDSGVIAQDTHDALQNRIGAIAVNASVAQPVEEPTTPAPTGGLAAIICAFLILLGMSAQGQSNSPVTFSQWLSNVGLDLKQGMTIATSETNWDIVAGGGHSLKGSTWLGYADIAYSFNDNVGIVLGDDALHGQGVSLFNSVKGGVTLQAEIFPLKWTGVSWLENIAGVPSISDLLATPYGGGSIGNLVVVGLHFKVADISGGKWNILVGGEFERRSGQGQFDGNYGMIDGALHRSF